MTTKRYGGIFGRNPTFNNVTVDGTLTVDQIAEKTGAAGITLDGVTLKDGNVVLANGNGINFSATSGTGTSELFDDYEEGTFTPAAVRAVNFVVNAANYTKIGRLVSCEMNVQWDSTDNASGNLVITGLPFTSTAGTGYLTVGSALMNGTDVNTDIAGAVVARLQGSKTEIVLAKAIAAALNIVQANECNSATELTIQLNYTTAS